MGNYLYLAWNLATETQRMRWPLVSQLWERSCQQIANTCDEHREGGITPSPFNTRIQENHTTCIQSSCRVGVFKWTLYIHEDAVVRRQSPRTHHENAETCSEPLRITKGKTKKEEEGCWITEGKTKKEEGCCLRNHGSVWDGAYHRWEHHRWLNDTPVRVQENTKPVLGTPVMTDYSLCGRKGEMSGPKITNK